MKDKIKENNYVMWGLTLFGVVAASILLFFLLLKLEYIVGGIFKILSTLTPIFLGIMFAYLLNPLVNVIEKYAMRPAGDWVYKKFFKEAKKKERVMRISAICATYLLALVLIWLFIEFVVPSLLESLNLMVTNIPTYVNNIYDYLKGFLQDNPDLKTIVDSMNTNITDTVSKFMMPTMDSIMANVAAGITSALRWLVNIVIGLIVSVYLIYDKDTFVGGMKKFLDLILPKQVYDVTMTTLGYIDKVFGGFMVAKIIDSLLIGIITFFFLAVFRIPYALVISVIVGVTNIIPYFGPFIGAIPCATLLLLINPTKSLTFVVLILIIQQFDGNILGPKLIGNKTGIKSFWVLFSILFFGGLFGFAGMLFGVPIFAVISSMINNFVNKKLAKRAGR